MSEASVVCNNIGASILEYIKQQTTPDAPPPRSLLHSLLLQSKEDGRILVKGPHATSLAMNMAHAIASQCHCQQAPCQCFAVAFLTLRSTATTTTTTTASQFPLFCQEETQDSDDFAVNLRNVENYNPVWNHRALKRIQVLHFRSARDLIAYLLNLQASQRRPWGAIVVDGVDRFVSHGEEKNSISPEEAMHMTQILALLAETGNTLKQMGADSLHIIATMKLSLPSNVERLVRNWYPHVVTMEQHGPTSNNVPKEDTIQSSWLVKLEAGESPLGFSVVQKKSDGASVIVWGRRACETTNQRRL